MFTRKHYEAIASVIHDNPNPRDFIIACQLADLFAQDNPRFDKQKFLDACRFGVGKDL